MEFSVLCPVLFIGLTIAMTFAFDSKLATARRELFERSAKIEELESRVLELEEAIETITSGR